MWISKKEYNRLVDENLELKKNQQLKDNIIEAIEKIKLGICPECFYMGEQIVLMRFLDYADFRSEKNEVFNELKIANEKLEYYKQLYTNELQKRLELAEMVRKMDSRNVMNKLEELLEQKKQIEAKIDALKEQKYQDKLQEIAKFRESIPEEVKKWLLDNVKHELGTCNHDDEHPNNG